MEEEEAVEVNKKMSRSFRCHVGQAENKALPIAGGELD